MTDHERKTTPQLLSHLRDLGIRLWEEEGELRLKGPKGVMTPALRSELAERKTELLAFLRSAAGQSPSTAIPRIPRDRDLPLSFGQQRLWVLDRFEPGNPAYNMSQPLRLEGPLETAVLMRCFHEILRRHEILRTTFVTVDGQPVQRIAPAPVPSFPVVDLSALPAGRRRIRAARLAGEEARRPFALMTPPLVRFTLVRQSPEEHLLVTTIHHIISDGWSNNLLIRELTALYKAFAACRPSPLPELPIQYADFAGWQRRWLRGEVLEGRISYWRQRLTGAPDLLELPADRPRPATQTYHGGLEALALPRSMTGTLQALCREHKATLFMALLAAFKTLLFRYTGSRVLVVGCPIAGRNRAEIEGLIGFFVNTLAIDAELSTHLSFRELLEQVRRVTLDAYAHQDLPFEKLVDELQPERNMSHTPLFQVSFALQDAPNFVLEISDLTLILEDPEETPAKFDLTLDLWETDDGLRGALNYNIDLFDRTTIRRMGRHFERLLEHLVAHPDEGLGNAPLLTPSAEQQLLREWNDTRVDAPRGSCLHELFEAQVERTPEAVAVVFEDRQVSYRELNRRANQLAHHLRTLTRGRPERRMGICAERSVELVVGLYGILKAGGAYVPLDPDYPPERLRFMVAAAEVEVLLTQERLSGTLPELASRTVCLDRGGAALRARSTANPEPTAAPENLAYLIYTSGSTGEPKGSMISHRGIVNRIRWMQDAYGLRAGEGVLQKTPFSFDVSVWEFFWPPAVGARLVVALPGGHQDRAYLAEVVAAQNISTLHFVPSMLQLFLEEPRVGDGLPIKRVIASGEALPRALQERFFSRLGAALHNLYGPTEAAVDVTFWACERAGGERSIPIGRPIANTRIHLIDRGGQPVPAGVTGEIHIGGVGLARGYVGRPELTAESFVPDPFRGQRGGRLYRTGDLGRLRPDGAIEFLGRIDHQTKVRGFRIELGEIETVLRRHPALREAVVLARRGEDPAADRQLAAYLVAAPAEVPTVEELSRFLKRTLPAYMVPARFVMLEEMPLTPNGKIDRKALGSAGGRGLKSEIPFVAPRNPVEQRLAEIWNDLLGHRRIGVHDNFFDRGGNSLLATQVISRIREAFAAELPLASFFEASTIADLAESVEVARRSVDDLHKQRPAAVAGREVGEL